MKRTCSHCNTTYRALTYKGLAKYFNKTSRKYRGQTYKYLHKVCKDCRRLQKRAYYARKNGERQRQSKYTVGMYRIS